MSMWRTYWNFNLLSIYLAEGVKVSSVLSLCESERSVLLEVRQKMHVSCWSVTHEVLLRKAQGIFEIEINGNFISRPQRRIKRLWLQWHETFGTTCNRSNQKISSTYFNVFRWGPNKKKKFDDFNFTVYYELIGKNVIHQTSIAKRFIFLKNRSYHHSKEKKDYVQSKMAHFS